MASLLITTAATAVPANGGIGVCYSGGGITGMAASMCAHHALTQLVPHFDELGVTVSTASGGTLGYLLHQSTLATDDPPSARARTLAAAGAKPVVFPPPLSPALTYAQLNNNSVAHGHTWWANAVNYIPDGPPAPAARAGPAAAGSAATAAAGSAAAAAALGDDGKGWWQDVMATLWTVGYGVRGADVGKARGAGHFVGNFAALSASSCPLARNSSTHVMEDALAGLQLGGVEADPAVAGGAPAVHLTGGLKLTDGSSASAVSLLDVAAWSSAFWAAGIVESKAGYLAEQAAELINAGVLISAQAKAAGDKGAAPFRVHLVDGGMVDTTGIVATLQRGASRVLAQYNNNDDLSHAAGDATHPQSEQASLAFLFGESVVTDSMNSIAGPQLTQVFPNELYAGVLANLTVGGGNFARLVDVPVLANPYLGIAAPYVLEELIITANQPSDAFLEYFDDPQVRAKVNPLWPNRMPLGLSTFDANLMCQFERYKLQAHRDEILAFFAAAGDGATARRSADLYLS
jgi:hypothetical protein